MDWFKENSTGNPGPTLSTKNQLRASNVQWGAPAIAGSPFAEADQKWEMYGNVVKPIVMNCKTKYTAVDPKQWVDSRSVLRNRLKHMRIH